MTRGMTLGARIVRPLAAVAGTEVRIGEDRRTIVIVRTPPAVWLLPSPGTSPDTGES